MALVPTHPVQNTNYLIHPHHRNRNPEKSQWTVTHQEELQSFTRALAAEWTVDSFGWGVHVVNGVASYLGIAVDKTTSLIIAKFIKDGVMNQWHGYPANHVENQQDIPPESVVNKWLNEGVLPTAKISKISKGKKCKL